MPPRSLLLNVSITAKEIDSIGKDQTVGSVREIEPYHEGIQPRGDMKGGRQERIDSAASIESSASLHSANSPVSFAPTHESVANSFAAAPPTNVYASAPSSYSPISSCATCNFTPSSSVESALYRCSRCKNKRYCSKKCQRADWPMHKLLCTSVHATFAAEAGAEIERSNTPALSPGRF